MRLRLLLWCRDLTVVGSKKSVVSDLLEQTLMLHGNHMEVRGGQFKAVDQGATEIKVDFKEPLKLELRHFAECVVEKKQSKVTGLDGAKALEIAEAAVESSAKNQVVQLK